MNREVVIPRDKDHWLEMRTKNLNSTEISALFGLSPYCTEFELWHQKKDSSLVEFQENERTKWGKRLESAIANGIAEESGIKIRAATEYISIPELRLGSSFDFFMEPEGILEIKNVDSLIFKGNWQIDDDGTVEAPLHIELQVQHQMLVSGKKKTMIGALVGGNTMTVIHREYDPTVGDKIIKKAAQFWESIKKNQPPKPNFQKDAEFISKLYGYAEPGSVLDMSGDSEMDKLITDYRQATAQIKLLDETKAGIKAEILTRIGDAEKVIGQGWSISCGIVAGGEISYERAPYRNFRTYFKKEKS